MSQNIFHHHLLVMLVLILGNHIHGGWQDAGISIS
jgi:hypothetical protein